MVGKERRMDSRGVFEGTLNVGMKIGRESRMLGAHRYRSDTDGNLMNICLTMKL